MVVLPTLGCQVTVYLDDGVTPAADLDVTINDTTVTTDENGVALFTECDLSTSYAVELDLSDDYEGYTYYNPVSTSDKKAYKIVLALAPEIEDDNHYVLTKDGTYAIAFEWEFSTWTQTWDLNAGLFVYFGDEGKDLTYTLTSNSEVVTVNNGTSYSTILNSAIGYVYLSLDVSSELLDYLYESEDVDRSVPYYATVTLESVPAPARGSKDNPVPVAEGANNVQAVNGGYYCTFNAQSLDLSDNHVMFKYDTEKVKITYLGTNINANGNDVVEANKPYDDNDLMKFNTTAYLFVELLDPLSSISFSVEAYYYPGEEPETAFTLNTLIGTVSETAEKITYAYYKYVNSAEQTVKIVDNSMTVYKEVDGEPVSIGSLISTNYVVVLEADTTYYFCTRVDSTSHAYSFTIRNLTSSDTGTSKLLPKDLTANGAAESFEFSGAKINAYNYVYYKLNLADYSDVKLTVTSTLYSSIVIDFFSDADYSNTTQIGGSGYTSANGSKDATYSSPCDAGYVYIRVGSSSVTSGAELTVKAEVQKINPVDYKITVVNSNDIPVPGVSVKLMDGDTQVGETKVTGADGVVTYPDSKYTKYEIVVSGYDEELYHISRRTYTSYKGATEIKVELFCDINFVFNVTDVVKGEAVEGVTVSVFVDETNPTTGQSAYIKVGEGVSDKTGKIALTLENLEGGFHYYLVTIPESLTDTYVYDYTEDYGSFQAYVDQRSLDVKLKNKAAYEISVFAPDGVTPINGVTVTLVSYDEDDNEVILTAGTTAAGVAVMEHALFLSTEYTVKLDNIPNEYYYSGILHNAVATPDDSNKLKITLYDKLEYTFIVLPNADTVLTEGFTVTVNGEEVAVDVTKDGDDKGVFSLYFAPGLEDNSVNNAKFLCKYTVSVNVTAGEWKDANGVIIVTAWEGETNFDCTINVSKPVVLTLGEAHSIASAPQYDENPYIMNINVEEAGSYKITISGMTGMAGYGKYTFTVDGIKKTIGTGQRDCNNQSITVTLKAGDNVIEFSTNNGYAISCNITITQA